MNRKVLLGTFTSGLPLFPKLSKTNNRPIKKVLYLYLFVKVLITPSSAILEHKLTASILYFVALNNCSSYLIL